ncbi:MAG: Phytochrome-like protein cph2 [Frankiales bacterium]|nr:Phytochrome-like protein cph2 [Frankiales bacterium]
MSRSSVRGAAGAHRNSGPLSIHSIIDDGLVRTLFQPVVHLISGAVVGFEALSRGPVGTAFESPAVLIAAAAEAERLGELDWLLRIHAMQAAAEAQLSPSLSWLINVEPAGLAIECPAHLQPALAKARTELRVILEVVERNAEGHVTDLLRATDSARQDSWGVALDDVGAEAGSLALLPFLRPDVVKLDMRLIRSVPADTAASITAAVRAYAEDAGAVILAEGIETEDDERMARVFGATYGQGYRYGTPGELPPSVADPRQAIPLRQRIAPFEGLTPFELLAQRQEPQRAPKRYLLHISRHLEAHSARGAESAVLLASFQDRAFFTERQRQRYQQLSQLNALTVVLADNLDSQTDPRYQTGPLGLGSRLYREWIVIVISPHYAAAFVARDCGDTGPDSQRRFDYFYTHNRDAVVEVGRSFLRELKADPSVVANPANGDGPTHAAEADEGSRRGRRRWFTAS